ncbi:folylpolyglutamate synthase, mitochondrial-like isoform X2 [Littorina saxatilis]|uniref:tetrahydrofolate synthase n=1 Tax=Littorina saxatilis TaxID=31220 RepID=A0AAN9G4D4_9CAEN
MADDKGGEARPKEYERAVMALNTTQRGANFGHMQDRKTKKIEMILNCLTRINLTMDQIDHLPIIHVAGSKGKGSTCEYVDSILRCHGYTTGLFSSPHLIEVRERIRINGKPVSQDMFASAFWHVFNKLQATRIANQDLMPGYFGVGLLMALHIFVEQKVDVVILEVGIGGEYDATNFIPKPVVCGVASLHLEHTDVLGHTVEEITWHKAGIMKRGVPFVTVPHQESVMKVILNRAKEKACPVFVSPPVQEEEIGRPLGIAGERQTVNAALALQLCRIWMKRMTQGDASGELEHSNFLKHVRSAADVPKRESINLSPREKEGLTKARLPGRNQVVNRGAVTYYLDGAHTTQSMQHCVAWFKDAAEREAEEMGGKVCRSLVFRMKQSKSAVDHFPYLTDCGFCRAAFCPHVVSSSAREQFPDSMDIRKDPAESRTIAESQLEDWKQLENLDHCIPSCFPSIVSALWWAGLEMDTPLKQMAKADLSLEDKSEGGVTCSEEPMACGVTHVQVLVTGSLVMVGGALTILKPDLWE